jgi:hypothetical protein
MIVNKSYTDEGASMGPMAWEFNDPQLYKLGAVLMNRYNAIRDKFIEMANRPNQRQELVKVFARGVSEDTHEPHTEPLWNLRKSLWRHAIVIPKLLGHEEFIKAYAALCEAFAEISNLYFLEQSGRLEIFIPKIRHQLIESADRKVSAIPDSFT